MVWGLASPVHEVVALPAPRRRPGRLALPVALPAALPAALALLSAPLDTTTTTMALPWIVKVQRGLEFTNKFLVAGAGLVPERVLPSEMRVLRRYPHPFSPRAPRDQEFVKYTL